MKKLLCILIMSQGFLVASIYDATRKHVLSKGDLDEVQRFLDRGGDINYINAARESSVYLAARYGHEKVVEMLIGRGANVNIVDRFDNAPLHQAAIEGHENIVRTLIRHGANVNAIDCFGDTPLHEAAHSDHAEVVKILLDDPWCDHTIADNNGNTPEDVAILLGHHPEIVDMLHDAPSVNKKIFSPGKGLQLLAARVANKEGVYEEDYNELGTSVKHWITNIRKEKKPSSLTDQSVSEDEAGPSGYHSDGDVSSIATEDLEEELQQGYCSIQ